MPHMLVLYAMQKTAEGGYNRRCGSNKDQNLAETVLPGYVGKHVERIVNYNWLQAHHGKVRGLLGKS